MKDKLHEAEDEKVAMEAHWQEQVAKLRKEQERSVGQLKKDVDRATQQANRLKEEARRAVERPPSAPPVLTSSSYVNLDDADNASPTPFSTTSGVADVAKVLTMVSRFGSPTETDENQKHTNKAYVNAYASLHDDALYFTTASSQPTKPEPVKVFNPYNYSTEFKEEPVPEVVSTSQPLTLPQYGHSYAFNGNAGPGSVGSLRRDELVDPEDEREDESPHMIASPRWQQSLGSSKSAPGPFQTASYGVDSMSNGASTKSRPPNLALQASIRSQRLPPSASSTVSPITPMTPGTRMTGPYSSAPSSPANPLVVSRSNMKTNPFRAAMKSEGLTRTPSSSGKTPGAYMAPHTVKYSVKPSEHEDSARTRAGTPGMGSGPPSPAVGYMSATKSTNKQHQLIKESAKDSFFKKYVIKENGL